jgi:hypothetical protein
MIRPFPKPHYTPQPKPERLSRRKRVTAIVGMSFLDGILMLADTEETTSLATKSDCDKLYRFAFNLGTVVTGGAGDSHFLDCANQELYLFMQTYDKNASIYPQLRRFSEDFWIESIREPFRGLDASLVPNVAEDVKDLDSNITKFLAQMPDMLRQYREEYRKLLRPPSALQRSEDQP